MTLSTLPSDPRTAETRTHELKALAVLLRDEFDTPFRFYDSSTGERVNAPEHVANIYEPAVSERTLALEIGTEYKPKVAMPSDGRYLAGIPLDGIGPSGVVAIGAIAALARTRADADQEFARLNKWVRSVHERLRNAKEIRDFRHLRSDHDRQSMIAWDAMMVLEGLHGRLQIHKDAARNKMRVLRAAREILGVAALAWVPVAREEEVVVDGEKLLSPWDFRQVADHLAQDSVSDRPGYFLINEAKECRWGARFPRIANLLAVPVAEKSLCGWMLAFNKREPTGRAPFRHESRGARGADRDQNGPTPVLPFRRSDAALLLPFASLLGLHARASERFVYMKDFMVGLTRSLAAAIDAKDKYTYGHSERVARVAVELGRELGLRESEQNDIYLAGLLHDIGKIGIRDDLLTKRGPLSTEEFKHVQQHPVIGHRILCGLQAIAHLLPGVLYHHERYDGLGYPEGLKGDSIPVLARILSVADTFDAMHTSRSYNQALPAERIDQIFREGSGIQWDPLVIDAYFRCRDRLLTIRQHGLGESFRNALDGALRNGMAPDIMASHDFSLIN